MLRSLSLYAWVAQEAARRSIRAWPLALAAFLYGAILTAAALLFGRLGLAGGFLTGLVEAACISSYLAFLAVAVSGTRLRMADLRDSFVSRLSDVIGVLFVLWIAGLVVDFAAPALGDHAPFLHAAYGLAIAVFLNPVPEIISQGRAAGRGSEVALQSARFVQTHWLEWFPPNLLFGLALLYAARGRESFDLAVLTITLPSLFTLGAGFRLATDLLAGNDLWLWPPILALVHYAMIFRGLLFREIATGNWRVRAFRTRAGRQ